MIELLVWIVLYGGLIVLAMSLLPVVLLAGAAYGAVMLVAWLVMDVYPTLNVWLIFSVVGIAGLIGLPLVIVLKFVKGIGVAWRVARGQRRRALLQSSVRTTPVHRRTVLPSPDWPWTGPAEQNPYSHPGPDWRWTGTAWRYSPHRP
jgi:hypothetical protein